MMPLTEQISTMLYFGCLKPADCVGILEEAGKMCAPFICLELSLSPELKIHFFGLN